MRRYRSIRQCDNFRHHGIKFPVSGEDQIDLFLRWSFDWWGVGADGRQTIEGLDRDQEDLSNRAFGRADANTGDFSDDVHSGDDLSKNGIFIFIEFGLRFDSYEKL